MASKSSKPMLSKSIQLLAAFFFTVFFFQAQCFAHEGRPVFVELQQQTQGIYDVRWKIPPVMPSGQEPIIELKGQDCKQTQGGYRPALTGYKQFKCSDLPDTKVSVVLNYSQNNPALSSLIHLNKASGESFSLFNGPDTLVIELPEQVSFFNVSKQYITAGFSHILEGYDHLLFLLLAMVHYIHYVQF